MENNQLWMLQTRSGKRTGFAAVRIAVDTVEERIISKKEALLRVEADHLNQLLRPIFDNKDERTGSSKEAFAKGAPGSTWGGHREDCFPRRGCRGTEGKRRTGRAVPN